MTEYYSQLYSSDTSASEYLPRLSDENREVLSSSISRRELGGFWITEKWQSPWASVQIFIKKKMSLLIYYLKSSTSFEKGMLSQTFYQANIQLILKKQKNKKKTLQMSAHLTALFP